ncbi:AI-2E family transporter [Micromonospora sp. NPDC003197]
MWNSPTRSTPPSTRWGPEWPDRGQRPTAGRRDRIALDNAEDRTLVRRFAIILGLLLAVVLGLLFVYATRRVLVWILIAVFFAVALNPAANWTQHRLVKWRWLATLLVFLAALGLLASLTALLVVPLLDEMGRLTEEISRLLHDARAGHGPIGQLLERLHLRRYLESREIREYGSRLQKPSLKALRDAVFGVAGTVTVFVLAYLMVLQSPKVVDRSLALVDERHRARIRQVGGRCARTITGYLSGNLLISVICGVLTYATMAIMGVPYAGVLALLVAVADLLPLVGATLGAVIATGASFVHSTRAGIVVLVFFVLYQQIENHVLQPMIYARAVRLNPLTVLISLLIAADLAGILGALLAIPAAGIIQIIFLDVYHGRRRRRALGRAPSKAESD